MKCQFALIFASLLYLCLAQSQHQDQLQNDTKLAEAYLFGSSKHAINFEKARQLLEHPAQNGNPTALLYLGFIYSAGLGVKSDQSKAYLYYTFAAASDSIFGKMALAYRHWAGLTVRQNCEQALHLYRDVAKKVEEEFSFSGMYMIQRIRLNDEYENPSSHSNSIVDDDIIQWHQFLADKGDPQAQVGLGQLHFQGAKGVEQDHKKALDYFSKAAESGNANAMAYLGKIYLDGNDEVEPDYIKAYKYFKQASDKDNAVGHSGLGLMYLQGKGVSLNYQKAFEYFEKAANKNWVDGHLQLGIMYHKGLGVQKDQKKAWEYFHLATHSGHVLGYYNLAQMYANGTGTPRDCRAAVELLKNVAERGHWADKFMKAYHEFRDGNAKSAFVKYAFLSELGYEVAQSNAAFILDKEDIVTWFTQAESYMKALNYWGLSASQGYVNALVKLGNYHYYGQGTETDYTVAADYYRMASESGSAEAYFNLGYMHEEGIGVRKDIHLANRHYDLATEASDDAQVPVYLVKLKLKLIELWQKIESVKSFHLIDEGIDVYVISILIVVIAFLHFRRYHR